MEVQEEWQLESLSKVKSDRERIENMLHILITNSIELGKKHGALKVSIDCEEEFMKVKNDQIGIQNASFIFEKYEESEMTKANLNLTITTDTEHLPIDTLHGMSRSFGLIQLMGE